MGYLSQDAYEYLAWCQPEMEGRADALNLVQRRKSKLLRRLEAILSMRSDEWMNVA